MARNWQHRGSQALPRPSTGEEPLRSTGQGSCCDAKDERALTYGCGHDLQRCRRRGPEQVALARVISPVESHAYVTDVRVVLVADDSSALRVEPSDCSKRADASVEGRSPSSQTAR